MLWEFIVNFKYEENEISHKCYHLIVKNINYTLFVFVWMAILK